jgi:8-hydroxy-5-deazaflavin:NADPH oxidoreductase
MRVGILGSGVVGQVLGAAFATLGNDVKIGSREPGSDKLKAWQGKVGSKASAGTFAETAKFGELLVLATAWAGTESAIQLSGPDHSVGKVVIDATNPLDFSGGGPGLAVSGKDSGGEQVQRWLPKAKVVKAFNMVGNAHMFKPQFPGGPPTMLYAGNDDSAKATVAKILADFGWESVDLGGIESSRYIEGIAMAWIVHYVQTKSANHAFKLLRK